MRSLLFDIAVVVLAVGSVPTDSSPLAIGEHLAIGAGLLVRRRFPELAVVGGLAVVSVNGSPLPAVIGLYTMARRRGPNLALWCAGGLTVVCLVVAELDVQGEWNGFPLVVGVAAKTAVYSVSLVLGLWLHQRAASLTTTRERIERAEREQELLAERAVSDERRRIAREMHDVVAHRASVMTLQAGALAVRAADERTAETAEVIRDNSAKALSELRDMLQVLRDTGGDEAGSDVGTPAGPAVSDIASLVREATDAGADIELRMPDELPETSAAVGRSAYRVVQEALTNAAKHAPRAPVRVDVELIDERLVLTVDNDRSDAVAHAVFGTGYGLVGMRERVAFVGGSVNLGPTSGGGYRVCAELPLRAPDDQQHGPDSPGAGR